MTKGNVDGQDRSAAAGAGGSAAGIATAPRPTLSKRKKLLFALVTLALMLGGLEMVLALCGIRPVLYSEDPFVGFVSGIPLFVETTLPDGKVVLETARNKLQYFNPQRFPKEKAPGTFRIFCPGESTTFGQPYMDTTSFAGWLRCFLPVADPSRTWEVVNAGGISYASYRLALLMEELCRYEPDLFIVYVGHNEFLEERTYENIRERSSVAARVEALASRLRIYAAGKRLLGRGPGGQQVRAEQKRDLLAAEVNTVLDNSVGPSAYKRDDALHERVLEHYRLSLHRMIDIAQSAGAKIMFVTPASKLKDCSPFKSDHRSGLSQAELARWNELYEEARARAKAGRLEEALASVESAETIDGRFADLLFLKGEILYDLQRYEEAKAAFVRARDEDICTLRATTRMCETVADVASERGVPLIDFVGLIDAISPHSIAGEEYFLDHVHPSINGHRLMALKLLGAMNDAGMVKIRPSFDEQAIESVRQNVEAGIDRAAHARALHHVSIVLGWAGKLDEAARLADQALEILPDDPEILHHAGINAQRDGRIGDAIGYYSEALRHDPAHPGTHQRLGVALAEQGKVEEAVTHFQEELRLNPGDAETHYNLATAYSALGRNEEAMSTYREALRLKPDYAAAHHNLAAGLVREGRNDEAIEHYQEALRIQPNLVQSLWGLGELLGRKGTISEAVAQYDRIIRIDGQYAPHVYLELGLMMLRNGDTNSALGYLRKAEAADPGIRDLQARLGEAFIQCMSWSDAERALGNALSNSSEPAVVHDALGTVYYKQQRFDEAIKQHTRSIELQPQRSEAHVNLALALTEIGDVDRAIELLHSAIELDPSSAVPHFYLAQLYEGSRKSPEEAAEHRRRYMELREAGKTEDGR